MALIGNVIWFLFGGFFLGLAWWFSGLLMIVFIITIPFAKACFVFGSFCFFPFGREMISRKELTDKDDIGTGALGLIGNIIWFILAGLWLAIGHVLWAILFFITIIGIPFGIQAFKFVPLALFPFGKEIVHSKDLRDDIGVARAAD